MRALVGCGIVAAILGVAEWSQGQANPTQSNLQLDWPRIEGCPSEEQVRRAIAQHLADASGRSNAVVATAVIEQAAGYRLFLYTRSGTAAGVRELSGDSCHSVADAAVVILAIMLGADSAAPAVEDRGEDGAIGPRRLPKVLAPPAAPSRVTLIRRELRLGKGGTESSLSPQAGIGAWVPVGSMRSPRLGVMADAVAVLAGWRLVAQAGWVPEQRIGLAGDSSRGAWISMISVGLSVGPALRRGRWEFVPRLGFSEQILRGTGFGVDLPMPSSAYFASARLGTLLQLGLTPRIFLQSLLDLSLPLHRPSILVEPGGEVLRPARLGLDAGLLLALRF